MMLGLRRAGRRCAGFFLLGVLTVVSLSACGPTPQATPLPDLVIAVEARLKSNPLLEWGDGCIVQQRALVASRRRSNRPRQECWEWGCGRLHRSTERLRHRNGGRPESRGRYSSGVLHECSQ